MNRAFLIGRVDSTPELKVTPGGDVFLRLRMVTRERWNDRGTGEVREETVHHTVLFSGPRAEALVQTLQAGDRVGVEGRIAYRRPDDSRRNLVRVDIRANAIHLLGARSGRVAEAG
ncbi:MAG: single-stranded DNA-binding protein [Myxococcota bacterium]